MPARDTIPTYDETMGRSYGRECRRGPPDGKKNNVPGEETRNSTVRESLTTLRFRERRRETIIEWVGGSFSRLNSNSVPPFFDVRIVYYLLLLTVDNSW